MKKLYRYAISSAVVIIIASCFLLLQANATNEEAAGNDADTDELERQMKIKELRAESFYVGDR